MDSLIGGLAGLGLGIGLLLAYVIRQRRILGRMDSLDAENRFLKGEIDRSQSTEKELRKDLREAEIERTEKATLNDELHRKLEKQVIEQEAAAKRMQERFENLANKILDQKSAKFTEANKENLKNVLGPLDKDIKAFRKKVQDIHEKDLSQHASLKEFLGNLQRTQNQLSEDARNLTTALKGDSKKQGDWGEFILERTLEASGLVKGQEFTMQDTFDRQRPDAIIRLPEGRAIVIDSKVSLTAYERSISLDDETLREEALREHLQSMKKHVNELSEKDYSAIERINAPDF
ncbi:MAG: DNA recombination protein RmuC, partial [Verrucomicrobiota bacterium]|nr:DNA recombination protein RmuC [Verrucomicrobiota bacterium]